MERNRTTISLSLPVDLVDRLRRKAEQERRTLSSVVEHMLTPPAKKRGKK